LIEARLQPLGAEGGIVSIGNAGPEDGSAERKIETCIEPPCHPINLSGCPLKR
jgi:hypothetical protein